MMPRWMLYAYASMLMAGFTTILAKVGLKGVNSDLALVVRTSFVFVFVLAIATITVPLDALKELNSTNFIWLGFSAATTALSWLFFYRAIEIGHVSSVALIDKGSVLITVFASILLFGEASTLSKMIGTLMIVGGLIFISQS